MAFQGFLKQSTATTLKLGPFVDKGDGVTYETGMAAAMNHADTGVRISKNGGTFAARTTATEPVYDAFGYYLVNLDGTDTATVGRLKVIFGAAATCLPCEADFCVLEETTFDALITNAAGAAGGLILNGAANAGTTTFANLTVTGILTSGTMTNTNTVLGVTTCGTWTQTGAAAWGNTTMGTLGVGATTLASLYVTAGTTLHGAVALDSTLAVTGTTTLTGTVTASSIILTGLFQANQVTVTTTTDLTGDVHFYGNWHVTGTTQFEGAVLYSSTETHTGAVTNNGGTALGATTIGTLTQTGAASLGVGSGVTFAASNFGVITGTLPAIPNNWITAAGITDGAITNAKVADDVDVNCKTLTNGAIKAATFHTDVDAEAAAWIWDAVMADYVDALSTGQYLYASVNEPKTTGVVVSSIAVGVIDATAIAADAITADKIADDAIGNEHWNVTAVAGCSLASTGLDAISTTAPTNVATNFREMMVQVWRRFFKKATRTADTLSLFADNNSTVVTTQTISDIGGTETQGPAGTP